MIEALKRWATKRPSQATRRMARRANDYPRTGHGATVNMTPPADDQMRIARLSVATMVVAMERDPELRMRVRRALGLGPRR